MKTHCKSAWIMIYLRYYYFLKKKSFLNHLENTDIKLFIDIENTPYVCVKIDRFAQIAFFLGFPPPPPPPP